MDGDDGNRRERDSAFARSLAVRLSEPPSLSRISQRGPRPKEESNEKTEARIARKGAPTVNRDGDSTTTTTTMIDDL